MQTAGNHVPIEGIEDEPTRNAIRMVVDMLRSSTTTRSGALSAIPGLNRSNVGATYFATDFNRLYRWTGFSWEDDWGAPPRKQIGWFMSAPNPQEGWARADGRTVQISTASATAERYKTPIVSPIEGAVPWVRL